MKIKKILNFKRLLFTSLAAVALLGATQPVLASSMNHMKDIAGSDKIVK